MGNPQPDEPLPHHFGQPGAPIPGLTKELSAKVRASAAMAIEIRQTGLEALLSLVRASRARQLPTETLKLMSSPHVQRMVEAAETRVMGTPTQNIDLNAKVNVNVKVSKRVRALRSLQLLRHAGDEAFDITPLEEPETIEAEAVAEDDKPRKRKAPSK